MASIDLISYLIVGPVLFLGAFLPICLAILFMETQNDD